MRKTILLFLSLAKITFEQRTVYQNCLAETVKYVAPNGDCFLAYANSQSFWSARSFCESFQGGQLAVLDSQEIRNGVAQIATGYSWVGLEQEAGSAAPDKGWAWFDRTGRKTPLNAAKGSEPWYFDQPEDGRSVVESGRENHAALMHGHNTVGDWPGATHLHVLCQFKEYTTTTSTTSTTSVTTTTSTTSTSTSTTTSTTTTTTTTAKPVLAFSILKTYRFKRIASDVSRPYVSFETTLEQCQEACLGDESCSFASFEGKGLTEICKLFAEELNKDEMEDGSGSLVEIVRHQTSKFGLP